MSQKRILIFRQDNIGDFLLFSGALQHIRHLYPNDHVTLAVRSHLINLVELCPYVDNCIPIDGFTWWEKIKKTRYGFLIKHKWLIHKCNRLWNRFFGPFDIVIYPVKSSYLSPLEIVYCLGANKTYGISGCEMNSSQESYPPDLLPRNLFSHYLDVSSDNPWRHEFLTTLDFLRFLGCPITNVGEIQPQLWLSDADHNYLSGKKGADERFIGLFPGASHGCKCWKPENYSDVAKLIDGSPTYVIFGSEDDMDMTQQVESAIREVCGTIRIINLSGKTTLRELAKAISSCDLFISMDTSGLHIAITAGVPTIGVIGGGHYERFVPWGNSEKNIVLTKKMACFHCNWVCPEGHFGCIQGVTPSEVAQAARELLKSSVQF